MCFIKHLGTTTVKVTLAVALAFCPKFLGFSSSGSSKARGGVGSGTCLRALEALEFFDAQIDSMHSPTL